MHLYNNNFMVFAMSEKSLVVQHNKIIEARYKLSVGEQRLIKVLVSMIEPYDEAFKVYRISIIDLVKLLGVSDKDFYAKVKVWSRKLVSSLLVFKGDGENELQLTWLSSAEYKESEGVVELEFSPKLKPFLLQLKKHFTVYELENIIRLKRMYSIRIYELLKQYQNIGRRRFTIDELRKILMLDDGEYKGYKNFKRWVLLPAQKELEEKTDISFKWNEEKKWRDVVAIEFFIKIQSRPDKIVVVDDHKINDEIKEYNSITAIVDYMINLGVTRNKAEKLGKEFSEDHIKSKITYALAKQREGKVKNLAGFLVEAIINGYIDNFSEELEKQDRDLQEAKSREDHGKEFEQLKSSHSGARNSMFEIWCSNLSEDALAEHRNQFMKTLNPMFKKHKTIVEKTFTAHLKTLMPFPSLREWAKQSQVDISKFENELAKEDRQAVTASIAENSEIAA